MAKLQGTILASKIVPTDSLDTYATHEDKYGRGGHRSVDTIVERDEITPERRKEGMTVYVKENKTKYILEGGLTNEFWIVEAAGGSGGDVDLSNYYTKSETGTLLSNKVDKEDGKGLSTNDFTQAFKEAVEANKVVDVTTDNINKKIVVTYSNGAVANLNLDDVITDVTVEGAVLDATTNTLTLVSSEGGADVIVDLSLFITDEVLDNALLDKADIVHSHTASDIDGLDATLSNIVTKNEAIVGDTKTKITYDSKGLVINGADLSASDIPNLPQSKIINLETNLSNKQDTLVSATNIKTINGESVLGSGNINIEGGDSLPIYTEDDKNKVLTIDEVSGAPSWQPSKGGSGSSTFTGTASIDIGGVKVGDSWDSAPIEDVVNSIINPELFPAFINPTFSFVSTASGFREVGSIADITFNVNFNRGSITPQYSAENNYRSGLPTAYNYSGPAGSEVKASNSLTDTKTITGYNIAIGNNTFSCSVDYSIGTQPKSSKGNDYNTPLPAGTLSAKSVTITGVYPVYRGIGTLSKIPLQAHGTAIVVDAPADMDVNGNRFTIQYPNVWSGKTPIVQQENELSKAWDNQNMAEYEITDINISGVPYKQVKYIGSGIGARKLKLVF